MSIKYGSDVYNHIMDSIPKLKGKNNYFQWAFGMLFILELAGLGYTVDRRYKRTMASSKRATDEWLAMTAIREKLSINLLPLSWRITSPAKLWEHFGMVYGDLSPEAQLELTTALSEICYEDFDNSSDFVDAFSLIQRRMKLAGIDSKPVVLVAHFVAATRHAFPGLKQRIEIVRLKNNGRWPCFEEMVNELRGMEQSWTMRRRGMTF
jgi:hypothetical protein